MCGAAEPCTVNYAESCYAESFVFFNSGWLLIALVGGAVYGVLVVQFNVIYVIVVKKLDSRVCVMLNNIYGTLVIKAVAYE
jgi:hypothetical protein